MKKKKQKSFWTIMLFSGANSPVRHIHIPKKLVYMGIGFLIFLVAASTISFYSISVVTSSNAQLKQQIAQHEKENEKLLNKQLIYKTEAIQIQDKLEELMEIETQLRDIVTSLNPEKIDSQGSDSALGGPYLSLLNEQPMIESDLQKSYASLDLEQKVNEIKKKLPEALSSYQETLANVEDLKKQLKKLPIIWPTNSQRVTSPFGKREDPFNKSGAKHDGMDIAGDYKAPIYATADGIIVKASRNGGYGKMVEIKHPSIYVTKYAHLADYNVKVGQRVKQGEIIGFMGSTGRSTGVHLHYEIVKRGKASDPLPYMSFLK